MVFGVGIGEEKPQKPATRFGTENPGERHPREYNSVVFDFQYDRIMPPEAAAIAGTGTAD
jgi:hypothetical protein